MAFPNSNEIVHYGERLVPHVIDQIAINEPGSLLGIIARSPNILKGFQEVTSREFANVGDFTAWWIGEQLTLQVGPNTIAYIVSRVHLYSLPILRMIIGRNRLSRLGFASGSYKILLFYKYICVPSAMSSASTVLIAYIAPAAFSSKFCNE
jgi:hypothetical protein